MRIRKRQVPLPLSSLSPVPVSDPHFNRSPVVQLRCNHDPHQNLTQQPHTTPASLPQPSDQPNQPIGPNANLFDSSSDDAAGLAQTQKSKDALVLLRDEDCGRGEEGEKKSCNDTRKKNNLGAEASSGVELSQFDSSHQVVGGWYEGEKAFPLKKRRGSFERRAANDEAETEAAVQEKDKKMKTKMKTKMNKKFSALEDESDTNEVAEDKETKKVVNFDTTTTTTTTNGSAKKRGRGGALMEGSRCSRVNGRGWRCCQQTLVGYSLCEHHLGKGRLRSMTSVRSRALGSTTSTTTAQTKKNETEHHHHHQHRPLSNTTSLSPTQQESYKTKLVYEAEDGDGIGDEDDQKPLMTTKRRMKLGTVKARSISSLLGQTTNNNEVSTVADNNSIVNR